MFGLVGWIRNEKCLLYEGHYKSWFHLWSRHESFLVSWRCWYFALHAWLVVFRITIEVEFSWKVMAHCDAWEKWKRNCRMEWIASTLHTTSELGVSSITTVDAHTSAASSRLNWRPRRFKWTRPFLRKTKSGFCACAITYHHISNAVYHVSPQMINVTKPFGNSVIIWEHLAIRRAAVCVRQSPALERLYQNSGSCTHASF
jgi:hypothetical protein